MPILFRKLTTYTYPWKSLCGLICALSVFLSIFFGPFSFAKEANEPAQGGAILQFPRGRFQEFSSPEFFNWNVVKKVDSITLKIYRANKIFDYDPASDLIERYDFLSTTKSAAWRQAPFTDGNYVWIIEGYNNSNPVAIYRDSARFSVIKLRHLDLRTSQFGLLIGFSRGKYTSIDPNFTLAYDATPTNYGAMVKGGSHKRAWSVVGQLSDFVLQGNVRNTLTVYADYKYLLGQGVPYQLEYFVGPSLRIFRFPRDQTTDGTVINSKSVTLLYPGIDFAVQRQLDLNITLYSGFGLDLPVFGSEDVEFSVETLNYNVRGGLLIGLFWPMSVGGELRYNVNNSITKDGSDKVEVKMSDWAINAKLMYSF